MGKALIAFIVVLIFMASSLPATSAAFLPTAEDECSISLELGYEDGSLQLEWDIGTPDPATWGVYLVIPSFPISFQIWSIPVPSIDPSINFSMAIPFPQTGVVLILAVLDPTIVHGCVAFEKVDTGMPLGTNVFNDGYDWMIQVPIRNPYDPDPCSGWLCGFLDAIGWP